MLLLSLHLDSSSPISSPRHFRLYFRADRSIYGWQYDDLGGNTIVSWASWQSQKDRLTPIIVTWIYLTGHEGYREQSKSLLGKPSRHFFLFLSSRFKMQEDESGSSLHEFEELTATSERAKSDEGSEAQIASAETRSVASLRVLFVFALFVAAIGISSAVYVITANSETEEYSSQYRGSADKVVLSFQEIVAQKLAGTSMLLIGGAADSRISYTTITLYLPYSHIHLAIASLAVTASSFARSQNHTRWPFIALNDFQERCQVARALSGALFVRLVPIVSNEDREAYEDFIVNNLQWLDEAVADKKLNFDDDRRLQLTNNGTQDDAIEFVGQHGVANRIFTFSDTGVIPDQGEGPFFPLWQESPTFGQHLVNWNADRYVTRNFIHLTLRQIHSLRQTHAQDIRDG